MVAPCELCELFCSATPVLGKQTGTKRRESPKQTSSFWKEKGSFLVEDPVVVVQLRVSLGLSGQPLQHLAFALCHPADVGLGLLYRLLQGQRGRAKSHLEVLFLEPLQLLELKLC